MGYICLPRHHLFLMTGRYVMRFYALSSSTCNREIDSFDISSEDNFSWKLSIPGGTSFLFRLNDTFPILTKSMDGLGIFGRRREFFTVSWKSRGYQDCAYHIGVVLLLSKMPDLSIRCLEHDLSKEMVEMRSLAGHSMRLEKHPCLCFKGIVSKTCRLELHEILKMQKVSVWVQKLFDKPLGLVSTCSNVFHSETGSLLPCAVPLEGTLQQSWSLF